MWTMEQLVERVSAALAAEYPGAPNGRVRELPDRRSIRWYTTIGLVDRPLGTRGRTVLYGPRHLLQLVAIKRRQASGRTLAEIQAELSGASEQTLAEVARIPDSLLETGAAPPPSSPVRPDFWRSAPADPEPVAGSTRRALAETVGALELEPVSPPARRSPDLVTGVPLGGGVVLLLPRHVTDVDRDEIAAAARPLLDLLAARGLTDGRSE
ncbi:MerR family transcriptional regulator [Actinoplanes sp. NPDC049802]|uniref:MerR family transcriptional regulator n=1 Tax=Actinoplanes sp. NPDC049802 TaxID=3154742 RepID=UPI0033C3F629